MLVRVRSIDVGVDDLVLVSLRKKLKGFRFLVWRLDELGCLKFFVRFQRRLSHIRSVKVFVASNTFGRLL